MYIRCSRPDYSLLAGTASLYDWQSPTADSFLLVAAFLPNHSVQPQPSYSLPLYPTLQKICHTCTNFLHWEARR